ncbi:helix-hairpin-helix domain-containing protein [Streptomyces sp. R11]|uniref:Helix-hairpin-helix domain-containing protein n=1 Tax=Streptomyces sp. R11 TaxID=3238625 RepID=A0AB39N058_9ACTN
MALRSRTRTTTATSGPGRGPHSDVRARRRRHMHAPGRARPRHASARAAEDLRRRAEVIFAERAGEWGESGARPPVGGGACEGAAWRAGRGPGPGEPAADLGGALRVGGVTGPDVPGADGLLGSDGRRADGLRGTDVPGVEGPRGVDVPRAEGLLGSDVPRGDGAPGADVPYAGAGEAGGGAGAVVSDGTGGAGGAGAGAAEWRARAGLALRERMPVWLQARCGLERRSVVALTVVLVLAAGFAVQHFWDGRARSVRAPEVVRTAASYGGESQGGQRQGGASGSGTPAAVGASGAGATATAEIVVDVSGKLREPGIHRLPAGSRVADALRAAGGVRPGTKTDSLNRARFLVDGEQVIVGGPAAVAGPAPGTGGAAVAGAAPSAPVALNTATVDQLDTLPGVGPVLAQHIIDYRTQHGGFRSVDELREVNGIGDRRFADLRNLVRP